MEKIKKLNSLWEEFLASDDRKSIDEERENEFK